jgi:ankyrin repeat protein
MESKKLNPRGTEHEEVVKALLEGGADPTLRGGFGRLDALLQAAVDGPRFIPLLRNRFGDLDIFHACALADDQRVAELLKRDRSLASSRDENDWMALHYCCASALYEDKKNADALVRIAQLLLKHGADPSATYSFEGNWPIPALYHACGQHNNPRVAEVLLRAGVSPCDNESVYHAADEGHAECLALIEKYTDKKALAKECTRALATQLHWNSSRGAPWLLAHGADPNFIHEKFGDSALHSGVKRRAGDEVIRLLLDHGADPFVKNRDGKSAIELAGGSASRKPNRPCPTGRDGKANTPQRKKTQSRILALLQRPSMQSKPRRRR